MCEYLALYMQYEIIGKPATYINSNCPNPEKN